MGIPVNVSRIAAYWRILMQQHTPCMLVDAPAAAAAAAVT